MSGDDGGRRRTRWAGLVGLSTTRLWKRATRTTAGRVAATTGAVALTIALLLVVTGIALALAGGGAVATDDAAVRVAPEESGTLSAVDGVEGPRLGSTNERAAAIRSQADVEHASPVLVETVQLETADGDTAHVLVVGVVSDERPRTVAGLSTDSLESGDPHYAEGSYDGPRTGELVLSRDAAERLGASTSDELAASSVRTSDDAPSFTVTAVDAAADGRDADVPVALVHLSELQSLSGGDDGELADWVLVWGEAGAAESAAVDAYPDAAVASERGVDPAALFDDGLAFATSAIALLVGVTICASFVATTMGMTVDEDRRTLAVLEAVGFPTHSRLAVVAISTLVTTLCGALLGVGLGVAGIAAVNAVAGATVAPGTVAVAHPLFVPYAIVVALLSGLVAVPYPLAVAARTTILEEVSR
ncbi:ABC transporter permease [Natribaculum luteum]|uniref:ABC transporter permease n=1 Tax=Natribaculum luteum TaxID=1586232 RepID=A0ABD5P500_9EURY|nr:ABC transporter permease [Natribaculum luteum]